MLNGYRFRLDPNKEQQQLLLQWIGCQRLFIMPKCKKTGLIAAFSGK